ncbi:GrpB family protein [Nocardioides sp. J2M5]|uniref:GrpB family protein n=1 Tax=Nocardioides palaemonis TaxID=2829810 RepID=UPI001BAD8089|nr:GrpB family protein [Nocardioides palaemonis]MBS2937247.1 GrpB family protein [Nocardioides palaemonis]
MIWSARYPSDGLVPFTPRWAEDYATMTAGLRRDLGPAWELEHVGSTSVPGLAAKPVIDVAIRVPANADVPTYDARFVAAGWTAPRPLGDHTASLLLEGEVRRAIAHLFTAEQWDEAHVRLFPDWLRRHPADRDAYQQLKTRLLEDGAWESGDYTARKTAFVTDIVNRARAERGLAPVTGSL